MTENKDDLHAMRHSLAHIMASAVQRIWSDAKFGVGPTVDDGFYYDIDLGDENISKDDFKRIEKEMRKVISEDFQFEKIEMDIDKAKKWAQDNNQPYKSELLNDLSREGTTSVKDLDSEQLGVEGDGAAKSVTFYKHGDFYDLCRGPHVESTGKVGAFKLHKLAGAYWRGKEENPQMQRLYGYGFVGKDDLKAHLNKLEEAKKRDHRVLGQKLGLFTFSEKVGSGLPLFTPKGTWLRNLLERYSDQLRQDKGFERVWIPHMTKNDLYKTSGHWEKFGEELFLVKSQETSDELVLKPMNCPHHTQIYASEQRSYKDLPIKYMEDTTIYRDEKSGELHGLSRVRSITQDDNHVFCSEDQIEDVATELIDAAKELYATVGMELHIELSFRDDSDAYLGDKSTWQNAQDQLKKMAEKTGLNFKVVEGEAAFYGPKVDFRAVDAIGRDWQLATVQLDFVQPARFELEYTNSDGELKTPVMIHAALLGSTERFLSVYIEHTAGHFPFWLAPEQVRIIPVNDQMDDYIAKVKKVLDEIVLNQPLRYNPLRYDSDQRDESLGKRIRTAEVEKIPLVIIVGPRDQADNKVSLRSANGEETINLSDLKDYINKL